MFTVVRTSHIIFLGFTFSDLFSNASVFQQLDTEANFIMTNFETLGQLLKKQEVKVTQDVTEEDVSELLDLHLRLKQKIKDSESVLELSSSFHLTAKQVRSHDRHPH